MVNWIWRRALPLVLAAVFVLGGCDDEEEKRPEVIVEVEEGTDVTVKTRNKEEMIVVGELALFALVIAWALFGPGATRRREMPISENR